MTDEQVLAVKGLLVSASMEQLNDVTEYIGVLKASITQDIAGVLLELDKRRERKYGSTVTLGQPSKHLVDG
jgi:hypothetical protein